MSFSKNLILFTLSFFLVEIICISQEEKKLVEIENFGTNPGNLKLFTYNASQSDSEKIPLVVVLHGCGQTAEDAAELTGWNKLADLNHFAVLYPQQKISNNPNLCFNWFRRADIEKHKGENESIFQMISYVQQHFSIDSSKLFITGLSAGAAMSVVLCSTHPSLFKAGAIFSGGPYKIATNAIEAAPAMLGKTKLTPKQLADLVVDQNKEFSGSYPKLIIYHGLNDHIVDYKNAEQLIAQWTQLNQTDSIPDNIEDEYSGVKDIQRKEYLDSNGNSILIMYTIKDFGHAILVQPGDAPNQGGKTGIYGINKNYHATYETAKEFGLIL